MKEHRVNKSITLIEALSQINSLRPEPLVLFVLDDDWYSD